jgi:hypothetical protein
VVSVNSHGRQLRPLGQRCGMPARLP